MTGYPTATAPFTVTAPTLTGIEIVSPTKLSTDLTYGGVQLYVGYDTVFQIEGVWSNRTVLPLAVPTAGPNPVVSFSSQAQPTGAFTIEYGGGDDVGSSPTP